MSTTQTRVAAVIGDPVAHSKSPALHNAAFEALGIDAVYVALRVAGPDVAAAVAGMNALGFLGASVTVPHKQTVIDACDRASATAQAIGAVNCLCFEDGAVIGHNTDAGGFVDALREATGQVPSGRAVLLGSGGAARAVYAGLAAAGCELQVVARSPQKAAWAARGGRPFTSETLIEVLPSCDLLVDCTSTGLSAEAEARLPAPVDVSLLPDTAVVSSLVYHREPKILADARARGLSVVDGAGMLVHQGARAVALWTGRDAPIGAMWAALRAETQNGEG